MSSKMIVDVNTDLMLHINGKFMVRNFELNKLIVDRNSYLYRVVLMKGTKM